MRMAFRLFCSLLVYARMLPDDSQNATRVVYLFSRKLCRVDEIFVAPVFPISVLAYRIAEGGIGLWLVLRFMELPCFSYEAEAFFASDDIIGALGLCGLAGASTVVLISGYVQKYGARFFSIVGGCVVLAAWILAFWGNDSYLWIIIAILLIDAGMQCIHLSNQTSVVALDASSINRINTVYMTIYFLGGSAGTFVSGLSWQHYGWTGVVGVGIAFTVASLLVNCFKPQRHKGGY